MKELIKKLVVTHDRCKEKCTIKLDDDGACGDPECCGDTRYYITVTCPKHGEQEMDDL